jgi:hypothetical protein
MPSMGGDAAGPVIEGVTASPLRGARPCALTQTTLVALGAVNQTCLWLPLIKPPFSLPPCVAR